MLISAEINLVIRNRKFLRPIQNDVPIATIPGQSGYDADFPHIQEPRRSARIAKKQKSVTFGKNSVHLFTKSTP